MSYAGPGRGGRGDPEDVLCLAFGGRGDPEDGAVVGGETLPCCILVLLCLVQP